MNYWQHSLDPVLRQDMRFKMYTGDPVVYSEAPASISKSCLEGAVVTEIDYEVGTVRHHSISARLCLERKIDSKPRLSPPPKFAGAQISSSRESTYIFHQPSIAINKTDLSDEAKFKRCRSLMHQIPRLGQTHRDFVSVGRISSQGTPAGFFRAHIKMLNTAVRRVHGFYGRALLVHCLEESSIGIEVFGDAALGVHAEFSTQMDC